VPKKSKVGEPNPFWKLGNTVHDDPWVEAIAAIDNDDNDAPLIEMLLSNAPLDAANRFHLAHLFHRKKLKHKATPQTPSYTSTFAEEVWANAVAAVNDLMKKGDDLKTALDKISKSHQLDENDLADAKSGKLGSVRRAAERKDVDAFRRLYPPGGKGGMRP
jgi:hypothetical protein